MGRIDEATALLRRTGAESVMVAFSGGKDSIATLDLCVRTFPRVEAFFMYLVKGLRVERAIIDRVMARYPSVVLHEVPHFVLSDFMRDNRLGCNPAGRDVAKLNLAKIEAHLREKTGIEWFAFGERAADGFSRRAKLNPIGGFWEKFRRVYPIFAWKEANVVAYLRARGIHLPSVKFGGKGQVSGGVSTHPKCLAWLKAEHPDDYARVCRAFPLAPDALFRWEQGLAHDRVGRFIDGTKVDRRPGDSQEQRAPSDAVEPSPG